MLKDIRMHLAEDDDKQAQLETQLSEKIHKIHNQNATAFAQFIPSMLADVQNVTTQNISIFSNKNGEVNLVDYGAGRTVYGLNPNKEISAQVNAFSKHCPYISITPIANTSSFGETNPQENRLTELSSYQQYQQSPPLPEKMNALVVFGIGLGLHIQQLVEQYQIKHLVIYEPERQYFQCSALAINWQKILKTMEAKGTSVYFQLEKDGRDIVSNIEELAEHYPLDGFYFYKHYNHPVFDAIDSALKNKNWLLLKQEGFNFNYAPDPNLYLPIWTQSIELNQYHSVNDENKLFNDNLSAFKKYFPDIYQEFSNYQPKHWLPIQDHNGEINLIQKASLISFCGPSPKSEAQANFEHFTQYPNKDGLVLGYSGTKLKKYLHYQFVEQTEKLLKDTDDDAGNLPETVKSLIMFGIGLGYQIEALFEQCNVEKLFLCEPNRDFFYASLFAIDWNKILKKVDETDSRIYINIGDDGSHLFRDLLSQFYSIGPYILASTYFYQGYYNANLVRAIAQLREQLQIVISMGEYYDHARYGIAHTTETIARGYPLLEAKPEKKLTKQQKEVPVFIVGNGPSLDNAIETLKEWRDQAIVVSCGTALMPLHKNGIVPDFHAEIEQNRSTFDWICRVGDFDYLKQISLISCNGIHPDTCDLFKDVYIAFKEGESSTISALNILGREHYEELKFAFPTVSNFATNIFSKIGFNQLYLFGVDLGFADQEKHHSKQSGYYNKDGKEAYNYREKNNTSIVVPGNFRSSVFTKHEFKVSKEILEQTLTSRKLDCFNTSDGAKIAGTIPLTIDNILLVNSQTSKQDSLNALKTIAFSPAKQFEQYKNKFDAKYQQKNLEFELNGMIELAKKPLTSSTDIDELINKQKEMLFASYSHGKSLLFYLLYGTVNYANTVFSKLNTRIKVNDKSVCLAQEQWVAFLKTCNDELHLTLDNFDTCSAMTNHRERSFLSRLTPKKLVIYHSYGNEIDSSISVIKASLVNTQINQYSSVHERFPCVIESKSSKNNRKLYFSDDYSKFKQALITKNSNIALIFYPKVISDLSQKELFFAGKYPLVDFIGIGFFALRGFAMAGEFEFIIPKLSFFDTGDSQNSNCHEFMKKWIQYLPEFSSYIDFPNLIAVPKRGASISNCIMDNIGGRGRLRQVRTLETDLILRVYPQDMRSRITKRLDYIKD
ncbi:motility associated factor glycosyltransferase family protein [Catenovulum adriaticum]|uniref:DUF115 domain-containing protein n=1 Tax=Catenovulum adriaticum TaxID=2984846 RepID=A0ABY7ANA9_9ALTE|nr:6-hydroxymethylpterin diphosphokinase MptE-like protein [Catenovulum sp. TS8]WAJ71045.1 DUF115 domain-containing protein [Catenovulum sp. TS8]